jgi:3-deoxy-D-manno-octulosonic-acid transferase
VSVRKLYTLVLWLAMPLILARLWWRGRREPGYRRLVAERFGRYAFGAERPVVWVHAVSVGEVRAAAPLVRALMEALPDHQLLVTCMTAAGREAVKQVYGESVLAAFLPYDLPHAMQRLLERFRPRLAVLMETEIWPNLIAACAENGVPVLLANARLSEKSAQGYAKWQGLFRPAFGVLAAVCAQSEADAGRLRALGAENVSVAGNIKFDVLPDPLKEAAGRTFRASVDRPVLLLASTRDGEEALLLDALGGKPAAVLLMLVPRHPQRFDEVASLARSRGHEIVRRSAGAVPASTHTLMLGDSMGEMAFYFGAADVAVIGGSFAAFGGQNLIEACAAGVPVVIGPSVYNFTEATRLATEAGAAVQVPDAPEAAREALALLADAGRRNAMVAAGKALCEAHRGAAARHLAVALGLLRAPAPG